MARIPDRVLRLIYEKYCPASLPEGWEPPLVPDPKFKGEGDAPLVPDKKALPPLVKDPDILYVGPFIDGIAAHIPEVLTIPFRDTPPRDHRRYIKSILHDATTDATRRDHATHYLVRNLNFTMWRDEWEGRSVRLTERVVDQEPGELLNSPIIMEDPETGEIVVKERPKGVSLDDYDKLKDFDPRIREDKRFGLHFLKRGDRFIFAGQTRRGEPFEMRFELRSPAEGSSLLTPDRAADGPVTW